MGNELEGEHSVSIINRREVNIKGAVSLGSYDEKAVSVDTAAGPLEVRGSGLNVRHMDLAGGSIVVEGRVQSVVYGARQERKSFLRHILR
jgi:sporulation protein YabP